MRLLERAGAGAIQLEDQTFPSAAAISPTRADSGAGDGGQDQGGRGRASSRDTLIIARTDAVAVEGFDRAIARAALYREAGADMLFIEAPRTRRTRSHRCAFPQVRAADGQHGRGRRDPVLPASELEALGFSLVIFPAASCARSPGAEEFYALLKAHGTTEPFRDRMFDFDGLNA